ncbi:MAG: recombinase family protein [Chloroflexi bacterium]|nr:recombinase family protein [Chloroflexota bacterium]
MTAAIYARVSSDKQDVDLSISAQLKALREYAARNGHPIIREFVDEAESGRTSERPAFREMVAVARRKPKPFDAILVWKYSRFARSREDSIVFKSMLRKNGVQVISISEPSQDTPTGRLLEAMIESLDEFYSANLGEEVTRGMRESASRGFYLSACAPYGYRKVKVKDGSRERVKLEPYPPEAAVVSRAFQRILQGRGLMEIVRELNGEGIAAPRRSSWGKTTLHLILTKEAYTGTLVWGRSSKRGLPPIRVENAWPSIVSREDFDRVQKMMQDRAPAVIHPRRASSRYLLSGLARCGHCGKALVGQDAKGGQFTYYVCGTLLKKGPKSCPAHYLNSQKFEAIVIEKIKGCILTTENIKELVRVVNEELDLASAEDRDRLQAVNAQIEDTNGRLERLYDALETGKVKMEDISPRIQQHRDRLKQLQVSRWELEARLSQGYIEPADDETVGRYVGDMKELLSESTIADRRSLVKSFVKEVKVTGSDVLLTYTSPMAAHGMLREGLSVLDTVQYGGLYWARTPHWSTRLQIAQQRLARMVSWHNSVAVNPGASWSLLPA